jgi:hypothetical protein
MRIRMGAVILEYRLPVGLLVPKMVSMSEREEVGILCLRMSIDF